MRHVWPLLLLVVMAGTLPTSAAAQAPDPDKPGR